MGEGLYRCPRLQNRRSLDKLVAKIAYAHEAWIIPAHYAPHDPVTTHIRVCQNDKPWWGCHGRQIDQRACLGPQVSYKLAAGKGADTRLRAWRPDRKHKARIWERGALLGGNGR
jgi:hypothetical protein